MFPATHYRLPPRRISSHTDVNTSAYQYINVNTYTDPITGDDLITLSTSPNTYISNAVDEHNIVKCQMSGGCRDKKPLLVGDVEVNTPPNPIPKNSTKGHSCSPDIYPTPIPKNTIKVDSFLAELYPSFQVEFSCLPSHTSCFPGEVTGYFAT